MYIFYNNLKAQIQTVIFIAQAHMWLKIPTGIELTTLLLFMLFYNSGDYIG